MTVLGLDIGTSAVKGLLLDDDGRVVAAAQTVLPPGPAGAGSGGTAAGARLAGRVCGHRRARAVRTGGGLTGTGSGGQRLR